MEIKILLFIMMSSLVAKERVFNSFAILVASFNNAKWCEKNLESIVNQDYKKYQIIYIDDCSPDNTGILVEKWLNKKKINYKTLTIHYNENLDLLSVNQYIEYLSSLIRISRKDCQFLLIRNVERKLALHNLVMAIYACEDSEIIVEVDGDDFLAHPNVLSKLNKIYNFPNIWLTYGQFRNLSDGKKCAWNRKIPRNVLVSRSIRKYPHLPTHLRTFYAGLFKKIKLEDLVFEGTFYKMTWDVAFMLPMVEMAGNKVRYISESLLIYNDLNDINDHKVDGKYQLNLSKLIRKRPQYALVEKL